MKNSNFKWVLLAASLLWLTTLTLTRAALADGGEGDEGVVQIINGYRVALVLAAPAQVGENPFHLQVSDTQAQPVTDATITVSVVADESSHTEGHSADTGHLETDTGHQTDAHDTDAHGAMNMGQAMGQLVPGAVRGEYAGTLVIPAAGTWIVRAQLMIDDTHLVTDFPLTLAQPQNGGGILLGFLGVNGLILGVAAVLRRVQITPQPQP